MDLVRGLMNVFSNYLDRVVFRDVGDLFVIMGVDELWFIFVFFGVD